VDLAKGTGYFRAYGELILSNETSNGIWKTA